MSPLELILMPTHVMPLSRGLSSGLNDFGIFFDFSRLPFFLLFFFFGFVGRGTFTIGCSGSSASLNGTGEMSVGTSNFFFFLSGSLSTPTRDLKVTPEDSFRVTLGETFSGGGGGALFKLVFSLPPYVRDCGALLLLKNDLDGFLYLTGRFFFLSFFGFLIGFEGFFVLVFFLGGAGVVVTGTGGSENGAAAAGVVVTTGAVKLK